MYISRSLTISYIYLSLLYHISHNIGTYLLLHVSDNKMHSFVAYEAEAHIQ